VFVFPLWVFISCWPFLGALDLGLDGVKLDWWLVWFAGCLGGWMDGWVTGPLALLLRGLVGS